MKLIGYHPHQVKDVLKDIGVIIVSETYNDFTCLCPFHANRNSPALSVSKERGAFLCFSPECGESGSLINLIRRMTSRNEFEAQRFILMRSAMNNDNFSDEIEKALLEEPDYKEFDQELLDRLHSQFMQLPDGLSYMNGRGLSSETCEAFGVGYSEKRRMITVPVHSPMGLPMGFVGRSIDSKNFQNSPGLAKNSTIFNSHRAKKQGGTVIITESSFDVMSLHQAGYPHGAALLGGNLSKPQIDIINRYFSRVILFTDFDVKEKHIANFCRRCKPEPCEGHNPGRELGIKISQALTSKEVLWACYDYGNIVYPDGAKDVTDMSEAQIQACISNAVSNYEYMLWNPK